MKIDSLTVGPIGTNCYILQEEQAKLCAVIDPGDEPERVIRAVEQTGCTPTMILLTHGHFDHYTGVAGLLEKWPELPVYIHEKDVTDRVSGGFDLLFPRLTEKNQRYYKEGDCLTLGGLTIRVLETPGHSEGSVCLLVEGQGVLFAGDTLFRCSCGRCDFPGGDYRKMLASLGRLASLEGDLRVLPGHDRETTLDYERRVNPYMRQGAAR